MSYYYRMKRVLLGASLLSATFFCGGLQADYSLKPISSFTSNIQGDPFLKDKYGATVRFNDDWVFVSAPEARSGGKTSSGAVYVYKKQGKWYQQEQIITTSGEHDHLGLLQIESYDDWLFLSLVGTPVGNAPRDAFINQDFSGSIQIYRLRQGKWVYQSSIDRSTPGLKDLSRISLEALNSKTSPFLNEQGANFGLSFSVDWNSKQLIVGAQYQEGISEDEDEVPEINAGAVYIFNLDKDTESWKLTQKITSPDGIKANDAFGACAVINGNYALVSNAPIHKSPKDTNSSVYLFKKESHGDWQCIQTLQGDQTNVTEMQIVVGHQKSKMTVGDCFGNTIAFSGDKVVIGAPYENLGTESIRGAAYFYTQNGTGKLDRVYKAVSSDVHSQRFSFPCVRLKGNKAYISDTGYTGDGDVPYGAVAFYSFNTNTWKFQKNLVSPTPIPFGFFGESFDIKGQTIAVGSGLSNAGMVSITSGTPPLANVSLPYRGNMPFAIYDIIKR